MNSDHLVSAARDLAATRFVDGRHEVFAALRTKSGRVFLGTHIEAGVGRVAVCAEAIAIGAAATGGDTEIAEIVAVTESGQIVPPCGMCRELISDYAEDALVILQSRNGIESVPVLQLLPRKYRSADYPKTRKKAEPGATDNPDDAQRLREDH